MLKISIKPENKNAIIKVCRHLFLGGYVLLLIFSALELMKSRIISSYFNLGLFFFFLILLGVLAIMYYQPLAQNHRLFKFSERLAIALLAILVGLATIYFCRQLGYVSLAIGLANSILFYNLIILFFQKENS